jgi:hypothetical protein
MPATPFIAVSWSPNEVIGDDKMNTIANNTQWLYEYTPRVLYTDGPLSRAEGIKIASGKVRFNKRKSDTASERVDFGNFFSTRCQPNIATGNYSNNQRKIFTAISGIGQELPDHRGFNIGVEIAATSDKNDQIVDRFWVSWIAMGY